MLEFRGVDDAPRARKHARVELGLGIALLEVVTRSSSVASITISALGADPHVRVAESGPVPDKGSATLAIACSLTARPSPKAPFDQIELIWPNGRALTD